MKTACIVVPAKAVRTMIAGFKSFNKRSVPMVVVKFVANLADALAGYKEGEHTGIDVTVPAEGAQVMYRLLAKGHKSMENYHTFEFAEEYNLINQVTANLLYGGVCQCCGRKTDHSVLVMNNGMCQRRNCVQVAMQQMIDAENDGADDE